MWPAALAFMGVGTFMQAKNNHEAAFAEAAAAERNAEFFKEQAAFAQDAGDRQLMIHERNSKVLYSEQASAFAKAGVDTAQSAGFLAREMHFGKQESAAIMDETNLNVRLASFRAGESMRRSEDLRHSAKSRFWGDMIGGMGGMMGMAGNASGGGGGSQKVGGGYGSAGGSGTNTGAIA